MAETVATGGGSAVGTSRRLYAVATFAGELTRRVGPDWVWESPVMVTAVGMSVAHIGIGGGRLICSHGVGFESGPPLLWFVTDALSDPRLRVLQRSRTWLQLSLVPSSVGVSAVLALHGTPVVSFAPVALADQRPTAA